VNNDSESVEIGSISSEMYLSAIDLAALLKISDNELSRLARSVRLEHPTDSRAYLYPLFENVTRYMTHLRSAKEKCYLGYIRERSRLQKVQRVRAELRHALEAGKLVEKELILSELGTSILSFKAALLGRGERLETTLGQIQDRESRIAAIRADDIRLLGLLSRSPTILQNSCPKMAQNNSQNHSLIVTSGANCPW
jgi:hypothetical protein